MSDVGDNNFVKYIYTGEEDEHIPLHATHISVDKSVTTIRAWAFYGQPNIIEVICHEDVEKIEQEAFFHCTSLRRVIIPAVTILERGAFESCFALTHVECDELVEFHERAFYRCTSLRSINLPSVEIARGAFAFCEALKDVKFGSKLSRIEGRFNLNCASLERITIPLKDGLITADDVFMGCESLKHVDLVEGAALHETINALQLDDWRLDMNEEIESINQILPNTPAGGEFVMNINAGGKALVIRRWIRSVLVKINHYKAVHQRMLDEEVATTLQQGHALLREIVMKSVLPFLELPSHAFEVGFWR